MLEHTGSQYILMGKEKKHDPERNTKVKKKSSESEFMSLVLVLPPSYQTFQKYQPPSTLLTNQLIRLFSR